MSMCANALPRETVEQVYWALVRVAVKELRQKGMVKFPDFGDFTLVTQKERKYSPMLIKRGMVERGSLGARKVMKFAADFKLRGYWRMLSGGTELKTTFKLPK